MFDRPDSSFATPDLPDEIEYEFLSPSATGLKSNSSKKSEEKTPAPGKKRHIDKPERLKGEVQDSA